MQEGKVMWNSYVLHRSFTSVLESGAEDLPSVTMLESTSQNQVAHKNIFLWGLLRNEQLP
jgi:hypothetical protein